MSTLPAQATCSRTINVPISAAGRSAIVDGNTIKGIYPELLHSLIDKLQFEALHWSAQPNPAGYRRAFSNTTHRLC